VAHRPVKCAMSPGEQIASYCRLAHGSGNVGMNRAASSSPSIYGPYTSIALALGVVWFSHSISSFLTGH
jgi:hypothetical protein